MPEQLKVPQSTFGIDSKYCVILVADMEDFSLWCQSVPDDAIRELYERFFKTCTTLAELFGAGFLKSTGDGLICIWPHSDVSSPLTECTEQDLSEVLSSVERAASYAESLQGLFLTRFGMKWPIPRFLRCALHAGALSRIEYQVPGRPAWEDYIGEPLNAASRLQKLVPRVAGPVLSEHIHALLSSASSESLSAMGFQAGGDTVDFKGAEWLSKQAYLLPSASAISLLQVDELGDCGPDGSSDAVSRGERLRSAVQANHTVRTFRFLEGLHRLLPRAEAPDLINNLSPLVAQPLKLISVITSDLHTVVGQELTSPILKGIEGGVARYCREYGEELDSLCPGLKEVIEKLAQDAFRLAVGSLCEHNDAEAKGLISEREEELGELMEGGVEQVLTMLAMNLAREPQPRPSVSGTSNEEGTERCESVAPKDFAAKFAELWGEAAADSDKISSELMIGSSETRSTAGDFGLLGRMASFFSLEASAEELRIDQVWWRWYDPQTGECLRKQQDGSRTPFEYLVAIEHELNPALTAHTFRKLRHVNVPLKVFITYPWKDKGPRRKYHRLSCLEDARRVLSTEATDTDRNNYLLVFGPERMESLPIRGWALYVYNSETEQFDEVSVD